MDFKLLPASAFVELALHVGVQLGCEELEELSLLTPLDLSEGAPIQIQVLVGEPDRTGRRSFGVHSRREPANDRDSLEAPLTCHATGMLSALQVASEPRLERVSTWPP